MKHVDEVRYSSAARIVRSWDPEFTKVTPSEKKHLDEIEQEVSEGIYYSEEDVFG